MEEEEEEETRRRRPGGGDQEEETRRRSNSSTPGGWRALLAGGSPLLHYSTEIPANAVAHLSSLLTVYLPTYIIFIITPTTSILLALLLFSHCYLLLSLVDVYLTYIISMNNVITPITLILLELLLFSHCYLSLSLVDVYLNCIIINIDNLITPITSASTTTTIFTMIY